MNTNSPANTCNPQSFPTKTEDNRPLTPEEACAYLKEHGYVDLTRVRMDSVPETAGRR